MKRLAEAQTFPQEQWQTGLKDNLEWLPWVDPAHIEILNMFPRDAAPVRLIGAGVEAGVRLASRVLPLVNPVAIPVAIGPWACKLVLSAGTLERLLQGLGITKMIANFAPRQRSILVEHMLSEQLAQLEAILGHPIRFGEQKELADSDVVLPWVIDFDDFPRNAELHLGREAARALGQALRQARPGHGAELVAVLAFPIQLCAGTQVVTVSELQELRSGDVILRRESSEANPFAILSRRFFAFIRADRQEHRLTSGWKPLAKNWEHSTMSESTSNASGAAGFEQIEDLPVDLVFEIGRCELPLSEIRKLGEGSVLPVAASTTSAVNILANGRLVGNGELVKIGAGLGVRVLRLSKNG
ncbi:type III secretion system cytoplasmic ring protein SctQ [Phyllobacterium zundukense]|uniref:Type III secretion system cytoplasmic ring protein SctQ n=1 Tax=Phyllobacterium zundukense TaxID=1867719 RepID=A0ACD4CXI8_9HYPH|nr:type III secretion system cytoplasmic ring protein SctQ [Phyllobacterium zundukense]UXN58295.1 type III secretion system cytoplasmic ring protein SctQ [Phyllobacterium zundukense]